MSGRLPNGAFHTPESGAPDRSCGVRFEITGNNQRRIRIVLGSIRRHLFELADSASVLPAALQVQVVGNQPSSCSDGLGDQSEAPAAPNLKRMDVRYEPMRLPEMGLAPEADQTWILELPAGQGRLTMIGR